MSYILYHPKTRTTGRALRAAMGIRGGTHPPKTRQPLIRWGSIRGEDMPKTLNRLEAVRLAGSKYSSLLAMREAGIPIPPTSRNLAELHESEIVLGRRFRHSGGRDIVILSERAEENRFDYYSGYVKPHKEYRIHVIGGRVVLAQKKYFREQLWREILKAEEESLNPELLADGQFEDLFFDMDRRKDIIRNNAHGWGFHDMNSLDNVPRAVLDAAVEAVGVLRLDFGAVDVISTQEKKNGKRGAIVLEVNTAPGLRNRNLAIYSQSIGELCRI